MIASVDGEVEGVPPHDLIDEVDVGGLKVAVVRAALELDVFSLVADGATTVADLAHACSASQRGTAVLVRALRSLGLLESDGDVLRCAPTAAAYLCRQGAGDERAVYLSWLRNRDQLVTAIRSGEPVDDHGATDAAEEWRAYAAGDLVRWPAKRQLIAQIMAERKITLREGGRILDLGCGSGIVGFTVLTDTAGAELVAVDRSPVLEVARRLAALMGVADRVALVAGDLADVALPDESFDLVFLTNVAQYLDDDALQHGLRRIRSTLRPGALFHISTIVVDGGSPGWAMNWGSAIEMYLATRVDQRDVAAIEGHLRRAGFVEVAQVGPTAFTARPPGREP